jgi:hypothetical protein
MKSNKAKQYNTTQKIKRVSAFPASYKTPTMLLI